MKTQSMLFVPGIIALSLFTIASMPASARPAPTAVQEPTPPPATQANAPAPPSSPAGAPPPPPRRGRVPGPLAAPCGPDAPPPPRAAGYQQGPPTTVRNTIRQLNFGPEGEVAGFLLSNGTQVNFPPEIGDQVTALAKSKSEVTIAGYQRQSATGKTILDAISITLNGQTIAVPAGPAGTRSAPPPPPPPPNGTEPGPPQN